jgi:hypothetical protein
MITRLLVIALLSLLAAACETNSAIGGTNDEQRKAVCAARSFLRSNGYLEGPAKSDHEQIDLELWDKLTYSRNGQMDWNALLAARSGTFVKRLYGVKAVDGGFLVAYKMDHGFRCAFVDTVNDFAIHLNEANCHPEGRNLKRVSDVSLACPTADENK